MSAQVPAPKKPGTPDNTDYAGTASAWLTRFGDNTARAYRRDLNQFTTWLNRDPLTATRNDIQAWLAHLRDTGRTAPTIRRKASAVSSYLAYAVEEGLATTNPAAHTRRPRGGDSLELGLTIPQTNRLLAAAQDLSSTTHALILLLVTTGLRISEAVSADIGDITQDAGQSVLRVVRKGGSIDMVPLAPTVLEAITPDRTSGPLFTSTRGTRLTRDTAADRIAKASAHAGLDHINPHQLRHTAATQALEAGEALEDVQALLGHASPETTMRYVRAINRLGGATSAANRLAQTFRPER